MEGSELIFCFLPFLHLPLAFGDDGRFRLMVPTGSSVRKQEVIRLAGFAKTEETDESTFCSNYRRCLATFYYRYLERYVRFN